MDAAETERLKAAWRAMQARFGQAGRQSRKALVMRAHDAMGADRALVLADQLVAVSPALSRVDAVKAAIRRARRLRNQDHWTFSAGRLRELYAAWLWLRTIARRDRDFFSKREAA